MSREESVQHFLDLIKKSRRGKFKVYIGMIAGVGVYGVPNSGFAVTNLALKATKDIKVTDKFAIPIFAQAIWNPRMEDAHLVFGISLRPW